MRSRLREGMMVVTLEREKGYEDEMGGAGSGSQEAGMVVARACSEREVLLLFTAIYDASANMPREMDDERTQLFMWEKAFSMIKMCCRSSPESIIELQSEPTAVEDRVDFFDEPADAIFTGRAVVTPSLQAADADEAGVEDDDGVDDDEAEGADDEDEEGRRQPPARRTAERRPFSGLFDDVAGAGSIRRQSQSTSAKGEGRKRGSKFMGVNMKSMRKHAKALAEKMRTSRCGHLPGMKVKSG